jgi:NADH-quinone oxidoreductase subunit G
MADVTITVDGKTLVAPAGALLIDVCRKAGIEIPAFCYYPGLSLQAACRMCLVRQEKVGKLQTACTTQVAEGQIFYTDTDEIHQARKAMLELLLANHPLDCPVCDAGGECELQDMTFKYGAGTSLYAEAKNHREEQQWSPAVFYDRPRCILCYRCVRVCGEGMDEWALGIQFRGSSAVIAPNQGDHLDCSQCGMCIDICPVGALTSGSYRYKTRPWEMKHVSTVCAHCADGCKVTLGIRQSNDGAEILRADNRDKSGLNGDFLCGKGRFGFDFVHSDQRLTTPLVRKNGKLEPATWEEALRAAAAGLKQVREAKGGTAIGVIGSSRTTNEENYLLQKFARTVLATNHIDHARSADYATFAATLAGQPGRTATLAEIAAAPAVLLVGGNPTEEHPLLAWTLRTGVRHHTTRLYIANAKPIKLDRQATLTARITAQPLAAINDATSEFGKAIAAEESLVILIAAEYTGAALAELLRWGLARPGIRFALVGQHANARGAFAMGLTPDLLPGAVALSAPGDFAEYPNLSATPGKTVAEQLAAAATGELAALLIVGANPAAAAGFHTEALTSPFLVVSDLFLTETAALADVVLPAASLYEKSGTLTSTYGDIQLVRKAADLAGVKSDFEILVRLADALGANIQSLVPFGKGTHADLGQSRGVESGEADRHAVWLSAHNLEPRLSPFDPLATLDEIERLVPGYALDRLTLFSGNAQPAEAAPKAGFVPLAALTAPAAPSQDGLFTSGTLGRFSPNLAALAEHQHEEKAQ